MNIQKKYLFWKQEQNNNKYIFDYYNFLLSISLILKISFNSENIWNKNHKEKCISSNLWNLNKRNKNFKNKI